MIRRKIQPVDATLTWREFAIEVLQSGKPKDLQVNEPNEPGPLDVAVEVKPLFFFFGEKNPRARLAFGIHVCNTGHCWSGMFR